MTAYPRVHADQLRATERPGLANVLLALTAALYGTLLLTNYLVLTAPKWAYLGFIRRAPSVIDVVLSGAAALLVLPLMPRDVGRPSHVMAWVLYIVVCPPVAVIGPFAYPDDVTMAAPIAWQISVSLAMFCIIARRRGTPRRLDLLPRLAPPRVTSYWSLDCW